MSSARISSLNSTVANLKAGQSFNGTKDDVGAFTKCAVSVFCDQAISLLVTQSQNGVNVDKLDVYDVPASIAPNPFTEFSAPLITVELAHKFVFITARNATATDTTFFRLETQIFNGGFKRHTHDTVRIWGQTADGTAKPILVDDTGRVIIVSA